MKNPIIRTVFAVILSILVAFGFAVAIEGVSSILHPWPEDFAGTAEEIARQVETYPAWVLVLLGGVGYGATMLICTFIATRIGHNRNPWHGYGIGLFLFAMVILNLTMLPYPIWYWVLLFTALPLAAYFGTNLASKNQFQLA